MAINCNSGPNDLLLAMVGLLQEIETNTAGGGGGGLTAVNFIYNETPAGATDGVNTVFIMANVPVLDKQAVFLNGLHQKPGAGNDYTIAGGTITFFVAPIAGSNILVDYIQT